MTTPTRISPPIRIGIESSSSRIDQVGGGIPTPSSREGVGVPAGIGAAAAVAGIDVPWRAAGPGAEGGRSGAPGGGSAERSTGGGGGGSAARAAAEGGEDGGATSAWNGGGPAAAGGRAAAGSGATARGAGLVRSTSVWAQRSPRRWRV